MLETDLMVEDNDEQTDTPLDERKAWEEARRSGIGSTDIAAILGLARRATPLTVYRQKTGAVTERTMSLPAWMGLRLENLLAELYAAATETRLRADARLHRHPDHDWLFCHVDRRAWGNPRLVVELKTRSRMTGWGPDGSSSIPVDIWCQVQCQMAVLDIATVHVATLFGHHTFRIYPINRDDDFIATMIPAAERFWTDNVLAGVPPDPTGSDEDTDLVRGDTDVATTGVILPATPEQEALVDRYRLAHLNAQQAKLAANEIRNRLMLLIGEYDGLQGGFGTIYYRRARDSHHTDYALLAAAYRRAVDDLIGQLRERDPDATYTLAGVPVTGDGDLEGMHGTLAGLYTTVRPGSRRFLPVLREKKEP